MLFDLVDLHKEKLFTGKKELKHLVTNTQPFLQVASNLFEVLSHKIRSSTGSSVFRAKAKPQSRKQKTN